MNPCSQSHGDKLFYPVGQTPMSILLNGNYTKVPIMGGATKNEGTLVLSEAHEYYLKPENLQNDEYYLKYKVVDVIFNAGGVKLGYAFKNEVEKAYFSPNELGDFTAMIRGLKDVCNRILILKSIFFK